MGRVTSVDRLPLSPPLRGEGRTVGLLSSILLNDMDAKHVLRGWCRWGVSSIDHSKAILLVALVLSATGFVGGFGAGTYTAGRRRCGGGRCADGVGVEHH